MPRLEIASPEDAPSLLALREEAARWMNERGIRQWESGEVGLDEIARQVSRGEWWLLRGEDGLRGALRLLDTDPDVWPDADPKALYVHGLVIAAVERGSGLGACLLDWAENRCRTSGKALLRLDCVETNARLRAYYALHGFREVGRVQFADPRWYPTTLLEKRVNLRA